MEWTNEKLEELLETVKKRSMVDAGFRKRLLENTNAVLEEVAGEPLPQEFTLKIIENDPAYTATMVLPDPVMTEFTAEDLDEIDGGVSVIVGGLFSCAAAISIFGCPLHACAAEHCIADFGCGAKACAGKGDIL